ncbi:ABATE domain-containing protein [Amycolatopsis suaedae]|uniref:ABATE domain-containing protein n=1 Tax=Amycolatopsis suaedae TaxID=2510978 RepID=UPI0013EF0202|nr:ABATE domain-containing protein [Amycolatopsis suaedae]
MAPDRRTDLLESPVALAQWIFEAAILDRVGTLSAHDLARVRDLRESLYKVFAAPKMTSPGSTTPRVFRFPGCK